MNKAVLALIGCLACGHSAAGQSQPVRLLEGTSVRREAAEISVCAGLLAAYFLYLHDAQPWPDEPLMDTEYQSYTGRITVPGEALVVAAPLLGGAIFLLPNSKGWLNATSYRHTKGFFEATTACTPFVTNIAKLAVGKKRPDYPYRPATTSDPSDARKSFWSGHAATSFALATYANLYLYEYVADNTRKHLLWKMPATLALLGGATYVAWSRVHDHAHDVLDVTVGGAMGSAISLLVYGLHDNWFGAFYPPRRPNGLHVRISFGGLWAEYHF